MKEVKSISKAIEDSVVDLNISFMEADGKLTTNELRKLRSYVEHCNRLISIAEANMDYDILKVELGFIKGRA